MILNITSRGTVGLVALLAPAVVLAQTAPAGPPTPPAAQPDGSSHEPSPTAPVQAPPQTPSPDGTPHEPSPAAPAAPAPAAPAAPAPAANDDVAGEATVVVRAIDRVPGATTVVSEREMQRIQPTSTNEVLRRVPGVYVRDEEGQGLRPNISIRGMDPTRSRRVLVLEDGIPISLAPYSEPEMYYNPPVERMGRVEVVRGSGNILYGPQTVGGVINYVTPDVPSRESWTLRGSVGDRGLILGQLAYGNSFGTGGAVVSALRRQGDGFRGLGFEVTDLYAKVALRIGTTQRLILRVGAYNEGSTTTYLGLTQPMFERDPTQNPALYDYFAVRRYSAGLVHTWQPNSAIQLRTLMYGYLTERDWDFQRYDRAPAPGLLYERIVGNRNIPGGAIYLRDEALSADRAYEVYGVEPRLNARFATGPLRHELDAGLRLMHERALVRAMVARGATSRSGNISDETERRGLALAGFAQDRVRIAGRLDVVPGVRFESYWSSQVVRREASMDVNRSSDSSFFQVIPGVSLAYNLAPLTVFGGVHRGYAPPRILPTINASARDRLLAAEESVNAEVGARWNGPWLRAELAAFWMEFDNETVQVSGEDTEFTSIGHARHLGVELAAQVDFARVFGWRTNPFVNVRYTFTDARVVGDRTNADGSVRRIDGNQVPYAVPHTVMTTIGVEHPIGITAQASWLHVSRHYSDVDNREIASADGLFGPIASFDSFDITARYTHRRTGLGIGLSVKSVQGYATDANGNPNVYVSSRSPQGIFPGGFGQTMLTLRWDR